MRPTFAVINCKNLKENFLNIRKYVKHAKIMAIVKADAYGHGMIRVAQELNKLEDKKPDYFGVAIIEEALELRKNGIKQPVLLLSPVLKENAEEIVSNEIISTVFNNDHIKLLKKKNRNGKIKVHIKVDTGMGRLGIRFEEAFDFIKKISKDKNIEIDGVYTHFATADEKDKTFAYVQLKRFNGLLAKLKSEDINFGLAHAANSGAIFNIPESHFDMVRPGISIYGYFPSENIKSKVKLKPVMSLISKITNVKEVKKDESVSYGRKFIAKKETRIAVAALGYADGFVRELSDNVNAIIKRKKYKQVGQVCMDMTMFEVDENIKAGDEIILIGSKNKMQITAWDWAKVLNTIPYEITCNISKRVPRIYI